MTHPRRRLWLLALAGLLPRDAAARQPEDRGPRGGQGGGQGGGRGQGRGRGGPDSPGLGGAELAILQSWAAANPGFGARPLPPGMRNRLAQGKPLPPGIARRALPPELLGRLPAHPGHAYWALGASVALVEVATGVVRAVLSDALLPR